MRALAVCPRRLAIGLFAVVALIPCTLLGAQDKPGTPPWLRPGYRGYNEPRPAQPVPVPSTPASPRKYTIHITILPSQNPGPRGVASVMAHLPPGADLWIEDDHFIKAADRPEYDMVSPPLEVGRTYAYTFRARWLEDGRWVTQMHAFPVRAGDVHCVDVVPRDSAAVDKEVAANLAKLDPADRAAAESQKFCAVQDGVRLGSMGKLVKVTVKGRDVYLCCPGCRDEALKDPDKTFKTAEQNKDKK